ncbi:MAG: hypothetical protein M1833_002806 [Piccolia ochrophora]|nr:MAG: hypothetical protein M1833_002806 [Piccolia ochrophora]
MTDSEGPENLSIVEETSDGHDDGISLPESPRVSKESLMAAMDQLIGRNYPSESNGSVELNPYKNGVAPEAMAEGLTGNSATQNMPHGLSGDPLVPPTLPDFSPTTESLSIHENVVEKSKLAVNQKSNPENLHRHNGDVSLSPYHPSRIRLPLILAEVEYTGIRYGGRIAPLIQRLINRPQAL